MFDGDVNRRLALRPLDGVGRFGVDLVCGVGCKFLWSVVF
jgi:hypothetical protein